MFLAKDLFPYTVIETRGFGLFTDMALMNTARDTKAWVMELKRNAGQPPIPGCLLPQRV